MKRIEAINSFKQWDRRSKFVYTKHDLAKLFPDESPKTLSESLNRLVKDGLLRRACRGIYVNEHAASFDANIIEHIAKALRRGHYNYISLESMLSEHGVISQIPIDRLTVMTTGRGGTYKTPYGVIEFTHTKRPISEIINHIKSIDQRPLRIVGKEIAWRDLKRVGRNIHLVDRSTLDDG